jgi:hypothetical protein
MAYDEESLMRSFLGMSVGWACAIAGVAMAEPASVPSVGNGVELSNGQEGPIGGNTPRRYQMVMDARALAGIPPGSVLTGIRFRQDNPTAAPWPAAGFSFSDYELRISAAATSAATMSTTYDANVSGPATLVKDGTLAIAAGAFPGGAASGATPEAFGPLIAFDTRFTYAGGSLCLDFNHSGTGLVASEFIDAGIQPGTDFVSGLYSNTSRTATTGLITTYPIIQFEYTPPSNEVGPNTLATTEANNGQEGALGGTGERRFQINLDEAVLGIPAGSVITGIAFRIDNARTVAWPEANVTITDYEVRVGRGVASAAMSTTYADNITFPVLARDGALQLNKGVFAAGNSGSTPEAWGVAIPFTTLVPYVGGPLCIEISQTGTGLAGVAFMDAVNSSSSVANGVRGLYATSRAAATGSLSGSPVVRVFYTPPPVGADLAVGVTKVYVADTFASTEATGALITSFNINSRSLLVAAAADQFDTIGVGSQFVGQATRLDGGRPAWPGAATNFADYTIQLSRSVNPPNALSTTFANNIGADVVTTRTGPLTVPIGAFEAAPANAPFTFTVGYAQPYTYNGGPLNMFLRHSGSGLAEQFMDATNASSSLAALFATSDFAPTGISISPPIYRFDVDANARVPRNASDSAVTSVTGLLSVNDYAIQTIVSAAELRDIPVGSLIDELWLKHRNAPADPVQDVFSPDVEVSVSTATNRPLDMSTTFAANDGPDKVLVYNGHLVIPAATFPANNANYARLLRFQRAFVYQGGDLCVTIRHRGFSGDGIDATIPPSGPEARSVFATSFDAATGTVLGGLASPLYFVHRFGYTPSVTTPNALARAEGVSGLSIVGENSTIQIIIPASELRAVDVGSALTGMSLRNSSSGGGASFPTADVTLTRFDVRLAPTSVEPLAMSDTFASNVGPGEIVVRDGPIAVPAKAFPASGVPSIPSEFAWFIPFDRAFIYNGGNLCLTIRTSGAMPGNAFLDTDGSNPSARGAMRYRILSPDALVANNDSGAFVVRFAFTARAFCPWDLNNDGVVNDDDFQIFVLAYDILDCNDGTMPVGCPSDFDFDRIVNDLDFQAFVLAYNELLCP